MPGLFSSVPLLSATERVHNYESYYFNRSRNLNVVKKKQVKKKKRFIKRANSVNAVKLDSKFYNAGSSYNIYNLDKIKSNRQKPLVYDLYNLDKIKKQLETVKVKQEIYDIQKYVSERRKHINRHHSTSYSRLSSLV
tara:strand:+ start:2631 stop:3041 length:411 start_codon:yes stop_codon:yes gene_type:complete